MRIESTDADTEPLDLSEAFVGGSPTARSLADAGVSLPVVGRLSGVPEHERLLDRLSDFPLSLQCTAVDIAAKWGVASGLYAIDLFESGVPETQLLGRVRSIMDLPALKYIAIPGERIFTEGVPLFEIVDRMPLDATLRSRAKSEMMYLMTVSEPHALVEVLQEDCVCVHLAKLLASSVGPHLGVRALKSVILARGGDTLVPGDEWTPLSRDELRSSILKFQVGRTIVQDVAPPETREPISDREEVLKLLSYDTPLQALRDAQGDTVEARACEFLRSYLKAAWDDKDGSIARTALGEGRTVGEAVALGRAVSVGLNEEERRALLERARSAECIEIFGGVCSDTRLSRLLEERAVVPPNGVIRDSALCRGMYVDQREVFAVALFPTPEVQAGLTGDQAYALTTNHVPGSLAYALVRQVDDTFQILELQSDARGALFPKFGRALRTAFDTLVVAVEHFAKREGASFVQITPPFLQLELWPNLRIEVAAKVYHDIPLRHGYAVASHHEMHLGVGWEKETSSRIGWLKRL